MWKLLLNPFFDAPDTSGAGGDGDISGDLALLEDMSDETTEETEETTEEETGDKDDDEEVDKGTTDEGEEEEGKEEKVEEDEEEEEGKEKAGDEEEVIGDGKISVKSLKTQYPDIFKKNPGLKDIIFKERELSKMYGTVEDAREAYNKSEAFDNFEQSLLGGEIGQLLDAVADTNSGAVVKIAENFLPELYARSRQLFSQVTAPVVKGMLRSTFARAQNKGDKQLALACQYISRELFESPDVLKATEIEQREDDPRDNEIKERENKLFQKQSMDARSDILNNVTGKLHKIISLKLGGGMSEFVKEATVEKITSELDKVLQKDKAHMTHLNSLWNKMAKSGFSNEAKSKIISASLARATQLLPGVIVKVKAQQKPGLKKPEIEAKGKQKEIPNQTSSKSRGGSPGKLDRNMSDFEFLSKP
jgi:hypothetical protein